MAAGKVVARRDRAKLEIEGQGDQKRVRGIFECPVDSAGRTGQGVRKPEVNTAGFLLEVEVEDER